MTMTVVFIVFASSYLIELLLWLGVSWAARHWLSYLTLIWAVAATIILQTHLPLLAGLCLALLAIYRIINLGRLIEARTQADYLYSVARSTSVRLLIAQVLIVIAVVVSRYFHLTALTGYEFILVAQLAGAIVLVLTTYRNLRTTEPPILSSQLRDNDLPTLTVAIPARNETADLEACLQSLVSSNYPKLEIIVLDDCSPNKRTPEIIRRFAHDGVRFMAGQESPPNWLAKNYAYYQLAEEANGELLLFCGVDARFEPNSLRLLVNTLLEKKKTMLSVIPKNTLASAWSLEALLVQPNRYAWELALPRHLITRPPVLSTCWLISAQALTASGGLQAVSNSINTERHFARWCARHEDGYSFMQSDASCNITTAKSFNDQRATAIRVRYPQLHRRLELTALVSALEFLVLVLPFGFFVGALLMAEWSYAAISLLTCLLLSAMYVRIVALTYRRFLYRGLWLLPFAALYDIALLNYSMWQYEFGVVIWKGRNVCIPVMKVISDFPTKPVNNSLSFSRSQVRNEDRKG